MSEQDQQIVDRITKAIEENHPGLSSNDKSKSITYSYFALKQYQADPTRLPQKQYAVVPVVALGAYEVGLLFLWTVTAAVMYQTTGEVDGLSGVTLSKEDNAGFQEAKANLLENRQQGDSIKSKVPEKKPEEEKSGPASGNAVAMAGVPDGDDKEPEDKKKVAKDKQVKRFLRRHKNLKKDNPSDKRIIDNLNTKGQDYINDYLQARVNKRVTQEFKDATIEEIFDEAKKGNTDAQTARKIFTDKRFSK